MTAEVERSRRNFLPALVWAFADLFNSLGFSGTLAQLEAVHPRELTTNAGGTLNHFAVRAGGGVVSTRQFYDRIEGEIRGVHARHDFPSCAPHANQAWTGYVDWWEEIASMSLTDRIALIDLIRDYILSRYTDHSFDASTLVRRPKLFEKVLLSFDVHAQKNEKSGAALQGITFGFIRASNPHLQVEIEKVRTGSKRLQRVGDVDGRNGVDLAFSAEVKSYVVDKAEPFASFAHEVRIRDAIGMVVAIGFTADAHSDIEGMGLHPLSRIDLLAQVSLWDAAKQDAAIQAFLYYAAMVEKNAALTRRIQDFLSP